MICLLVVICCLAAVTALTVGLVLKVVTTLVEAFLDIVVRYGVILICTALICLAVFILASMVIELIHGANILLLLLSLGLWVLSLGLAAFGTAQIQAAHPGNAQNRIHGVQAGRPRRGRRRG